MQEVELAHQVDCVRRRLLFILISKPSQPEIRVNLKIATAAPALGAFVGKWRRAAMVITVK